MTSLSTPSFREVVNDFARDRGLDCTVYENDAGSQLVVELGDWGQIRFRRKLSAWVLAGVQGASEPLLKAAKAILRLAN